MIRFSSQDLISPIGPLPQEPRTRKSPGTDWGSSIGLEKGEYEEAPGELDSSRVSIRSVDCSCTGVPRRANRVPPTWGIRRQHLPRQQRQRCLHFFRLEPCSKSKHHAQQHHLQRSQLVDRELNGLLPIGTGAYGPGERYTGPRHLSCSRALPQASSPRLRRQSLRKRQ
jgi:hypothetical protein